MSTQQQPSVGKDYRLSLLDEAVVLYHTQKQDFIALQDYYLNCPDGAQRYYFSGPDHILMGEVLSDEDGKYWHVAYAASRNPSKTIDLFLKLAPFSLDRVLFCRYHNMNKPNPEKFYSWESLKRISNYGQQTKTTKTTTSTPTPSCAPTSPCASSA